MRGGVVAYATDVKHTLLEVDADLAGRRRARSHPDVAWQMAEGVRGWPGSTASPRTSASRRPASPDRDPQDGKPVGTVHIAVVTPDGTRVTALELAGNASADPRRGDVARALALAPRGSG